jgi:hypothetical protein
LYARCQPVRKSGASFSQEADVHDNDTILSFWVFAPEGQQPQKRRAYGDCSAQSDRRFFECFPLRRYRVRLASQAERQQCVQLDGSTPPGFAYYTAVRNVRNGARLRVFRLAPAGREVDVDETTARLIFEAETPPDTREAEAIIREVGGAP